MTELQSCPSCGAPLETGLVLSCPHCGPVVVDELGIVAGSASDTDPDVIAGQKRWDASVGADVVEVDFTQKRPRPPK